MRYARFFVPAACLALAGAMLAGCAPTVQPGPSSSGGSSSQTPDPAPAADSRLDDGVLRFLGAFENYGGGTLLQGDRVIYRATPAESISLLYDVDTGAQAGWLLATNDPDGTRRTDVYDTEGDLLWSGPGNYAASISRQLLALSPGTLYDGSGIGSDSGSGPKLIRLSDGAELPLPAGTVSCYMVYGGYTVVNVPGSAQETDGYTPTNAILLGPDGSQLQVFENCSVYEPGYEGSDGWLCVHPFGQSSIHLYRPADGAVIEGYRSFCGDGYVCCEAGDGGYYVRSVDDPTPLADYGSSCLLYQPGGLTLLGYDETSNAPLLVMPDGVTHPLQDFGSYVIEEDGMGFLLADGTLLLYGPDGSQTSFAVKAQPGSTLTLASLDSGYALLLGHDSDYNLVEMQIWNEDGLQAGSYAPSGMGYEYSSVYYLATGPDGPLYAALRQGIGGSWLYDVLDHTGQPVLKGLASVVSGSVASLPEGCFMARRGFEQGFMDAEGQWLYHESIFDAVGDEDPAAW